jgi:voltage-gated potassium channel
MVVQQLSAQMGLRYKLFQEMYPHARHRMGLSTINMLIILLVILSFALFALETEPTITGGWATAISILNLVVLGLFAVEYVVRLWVVGEHPEHTGLRGRISYAFTPWALADLVAFLPELIWVLLPQTGDNSMLMFLRVLRLVRLVRIARFIPAFEIMGAALRRAGMQLLTALALALALVFVSAVLLYFIEGVGAGRAEFASIPRAIWWAVATLTTVGYGDIYPITLWGKMASGMIAVAGIGVVALPTGIFASAFSDELRERDRLRKEARASAKADVSEKDERAA